MVKVQVQENEHFHTLYVEEQTEPYCSVIS